MPVQDRRTGMLRPAQLRVPLRHSLHRPIACGPSRDSGVQDAWSSAWQNYAQHGGFIGHDIGLRLLLSREIVRRQGNTVEPHTAVVFRDMSMTELNGCFLGLDLCCLTGWLARNYRK